MDLPDGVSNAQALYWSLIVSELNKTQGPISARVAEFPIEGFSCSHVSLNLIVSGQEKQFKNYLGFVRSFSSETLQKLGHQIGLRLDYFQGREVSFD